MSTYLKKFYLDDRKLAQRALLEFYRALRSGRMIAFTGAITTESFGYPGWRELADQILGYGKELAQPRNSELTKKFKSIKALAHDFELRVGMSLVGELLESLDKKEDFTNSNTILKNIQNEANESSPGTFAHLTDKYGSRLELMEFKLADILRRPDKPIPDEGNDPINVIKSLWRDIGIERFATLNFDLELEKLLMLTAEEQDEILNGAKSVPPITIFDKLIDLFRAGQLDWSDASNRITRILPNGRTVISDVISRERSDRLIDFAVGSDEAEQHVMHLHGRCDDQKSLIFSYRDYDRLYRRSDLNRLPFEYGQRIMIGGNPTLFVGLGMSEAEINKTLEDFISNTPYHRSAPTFLLWNTRSWKKGTGAKRKEADERSNFRIDKLHRLGVFTIFDTDVIAEDRSKVLRDLACAADRSASLENLHTLTSTVAAAARNVGKRERYIGRNYRSMASRMRNITQTTLSTVWEVEYSAPEPNKILQSEAIELQTALANSNGPDVLFSIASAGWGKGQLGSLITSEINKDKKSFVLHINAGFCFDTDSFLDAIACFLEKINVKQYCSSSVNRMSRDNYFGGINLCGTTAGPAYCIVNGIDRFLDVNGMPLSAEFDRFIHQLLEDTLENPKPRVCKHPMKWLFLGSDRTRLYLTRIENSRPIRKSWPDGSVFDQATKAPRNSSEKVLASAYLEAIKAAMANHSGVGFCSQSQVRAIESANKVAMNRSGEARRISIERLRRAFFDAYLEPSAFVACGLLPGDAQLAMEILRALAFIGLPTEPIVLQHVPRIFKRLVKGSNQQKPDIPLKKIKDIIGKLLEFKLVIKLRGFEQSGPCEGTDSQNQCRYGLHRAVMTELRYRLGLPLSEAKLSTAFNMSLYVAQPVDGYIPEPGIHDELGELIDALIVSYKAEPANEAECTNSKALQFFKNELQVSAPFNFDPDEPKVIQKYHRRCLPESVACLRAALAVVRGYYSTTGLLTLDRTDRLIGDDKDGILLEHAERLDDLIDAYGKTAKMRDGLREELGENQFNQIYGEAEPFYPDELVWLHNERAVVRLAMGDLPEANRSFQKSLTVNKLHVEFGDRSHNWRRIKLNQLTVEIEQGELLAAERMAREILEASGWPVEKRVTSIKEAKREFAKIERTKKLSPPSGSKSHFCLREDRLAIAIALGYRGMCANLRGEMLDACDDLGVAVDLLRDLDEQRAFSYFSRLLAWALREIGDLPRAKNQLDLALDAAQSTRQMDLAYRVQVMQAQWDSEKPDASDDERRKTATILTNAMDYGVKSGVHRVRTEAAAALSKLKLATGDYEIALQYAAEAMTIATRYMLKLRMMSIRVRLGKIMIKRGDVKTGRALILAAIKSANRSGFQRIVDAGQKVLDGLN